METVRAEEIVNEILSRGGQHPKNITAEEDKEIREKWRSMPGYTCYFDAVNALRREILL